MKMRTLRQWLTACLFATCVSTTALNARADVPHTITNQGRLFDADGTPITGSFSVVFAVYDKEDATTPIWSETHSVTFEEGYYSVSLGSVVPFDDKVFDGSLRYFGITIDNEPELLPRSAVQSVPYALLAQDVNGDIHPTSVTINGTEVINNMGEWVGPPIAGAVGPTGATGPTGAAGQTGADGAVGATGAAGPTGADGAVGATGATGAAGPTGAQGDIGPAGPVGPIGPIGATGATGATGAQGDIGPQGPIGPIGATGATGATGAQGDIGPQGPIGPIGATGATGATGAQGDIGPQGPIGPIGATGATGATGAQGDIGPQGPIGPIGATGATGAQGDIGPQGPIGPIGATGATGAQGDIGPQGPIGPIGATGATGATGAQGDIGPQGPIGPIGATGATGATGAQGDIGPQGPIGPIGATGATGATGAQGPIGATGAIGPQGPIGATGATGAIGPQGPIGATGAIGPQGPIGATGAIGPQGPIGATGAIGPQGPIGATGATGAIGPQGPIGATGAIGPQGPIGATGAIGPQGPIGATGAIGPQGPIGATGATGAIGPQGPIGATGATGATGAIGPQGPIGATGATGAIGPQGPIGATGAIGPQGPIGATGAIGPQGPAGSANINGTVNTIIKFTAATTGGNSSVTDDGTTVTANAVVAINSASNASGNLRFTTANPYLVASSYIIVPGGAFFNGGTVFVQNNANFRGGIANDAGPYLQINGGTSGVTYYPGSIGIGTTSPGEQIHATGNIRADGVVYWGNGLTRTETRDDAGQQGGRSGLYETSAPVNYYPNASSWQHLFEVRHSNTGNNFALQIGGSFFDQDLWFRKTNNAGTTGWSQLIGAGNRACTAPFNNQGVITTTSVGGTTRQNTICATPRFSGQNFNDAQNVCYALGGHIPTYNDLYRLSQAYGTGAVLFNGDWIGHRSGDDNAYCVNNTIIGNFEGDCNKGDVRTYRCVNSSDLAE